MQRLPRPRYWIALLFGVAAAVLAYHGPASPRALITCEHTPWHIAFSPDNSRLAILDRVAGLNEVGQVLVCDSLTGEVLHRLDLGRRNYPHKVVFGPDGNTVGVVDAGAVTKWDAATGRLLAHHDHAAWSHNAEHWDGREILFSPQGDWLYHTAREGCVCDARTGRVVVDYAERWPKRHWNAHGGCVVAQVEDEVKTFNVLTGKEIGRFAPGLKGQPFSRIVFRFSADGTHGVYWNGSGQWLAHNAVTGKQSVLPQDWDGMSMEDCWSLDNRYYAGQFNKKPRGPIDRLWKQALGIRHSIHVFDTTTGREVGTPFVNCRQCWFAPDSQTLAVADQYGRVFLWDWPPPSRWPLTLMAALTAMLLSYGIGALWGRRRRVKLRAESSGAQPTIGGTIV